MARRGLDELHLVGFFGYHKILSAVEGSTPAMSRYSDACWLNSSVITTLCDSQINVSTTSLSYRIGVEDVGAVCELVSMSKWIETLRLSTALDCTQACRHTVMSALLGSQLSFSLATLDLGSFGDIGFKNACEILRWTQCKRCVLTQLDLTNTFKLERPDDVAILLDACRGTTCPVLKDLRLNNCLNKVEGAEYDETEPFPDQAVFTLPSVVLRAGWPLQALDLSQQPDYMLCDITVRTIVDAMRSQHTNSVLGCQLRSLGLCEGMIEDQGAVLLANTIKEPWCKLETLWMSYNSIGDEGIVAFAGAVCSPGNTLHVLHLYGSDMEMSEAGGSAMLAAILDEVDGTSRRNECQLTELALPDYGDDMLELADVLSETMEDVGISYWVE